MLIPRTLVPESDRDIARSADEIGLPCLVKPRQSHLRAAQIGCKFTLARSVAEVRRSYYAARDAGLDVLIQEHVPGPDRHGVNENAYRSSRGILAECTARKIRQGPPRSGLPRVVLSTDIPSVVDLGRRLLDALAVEGFACTEFNSTPAVALSSCWRSTGATTSSLLSIRSGLNFPWIAYRHPVAAEVPATTRANQGLYWIDEWLELAFMRTRAGRDTESWGSDPASMARPPRLRRARSPRSGTVSRPRPEDRSRRIARAP